MFDDNAQTASTSLVGLLSSRAFERLISSSTDLINADMCVHLRLLVELSAALYCIDNQQSYAGLGTPNLWLIHAYIGRKVLRDLDVALSDVINRVASPEYLKRLFLVILATIIAVGYSKACTLTTEVTILLQAVAKISITNCKKSPASDDSQPKDFAEAQKQLLRVLAHYLLLIGDRAQLFEASVSASRVIEDALVQWQRRATFEWSEMPPPISNGFVDNSNPYGSTNATSHCRYHLSCSHTATESCTPVGSFGTCVKDIIDKHDGGDPSPMDELLAGIEHITLESRSQAAVSRASDFGFSPSSGYAQTISENTITTPQCELTNQCLQFGCHNCSTDCPCAPIPTDQTAIQLPHIYYYSNYLANLPGFEENEAMMNQSFLTLANSTIQDNSGPYSTNPCAICSSVSATHSFDRTDEEFEDFTSRQGSIKLLV